MRTSPILAGLLAATTALTPAAASAQTRVQLGAHSGVSQTLTLPKGKSANIDLPVDAREVVVSNPKVADVVTRSSRRMSVMGVGSGRTDATFFDAAGRVILSLDIRVDQEVGVLADTITRMIPGAQVQVEALNDSIVLSGMVADVGDADKAMKLATAFIGGDGRGGPKVLNMLSIAGKEQVMLKVRVVEMQRTVIKQLGFNLSAVLNQIGEPQYLLGSALGFAVNGGALGGVSGGYKLDTTVQPEAILVDPVTGRATDAKVVARDYPLAGRATNRAGDPGLNQANATIQALERVGLVRTLAEPNLTAVTGESAKFLAGGEYPVPVAQDSTGAISVEFKPYGVGLGFTPVVLSGGRISLRLSTEVSELSAQGALTLPGSSQLQGLTIPALSVRRAETTVEMPSGGSMMIAGLLQERTKQSIDALPGLTDLPYIGSLFRSRDFLSGETELVIIITPYLVDPTSPSRLQTPADGFRVASDPDTVLLGKLNKRSAPAIPGAPPPASYQGPVGYVIE
jgi:pilus assembly protein CpaC